MLSLPLFLFCREPCCSSSIPRDFCPRCSTGRRKAPRCASRCSLLTPRGWDWEESGVARGISKLLKPLCRKLFRTNDEEALSAIGMNLSTNLLGIGGAATPYGIKAASLLEKNKDAHYSSSMLFVVNATSLQLIPTSVVALRIAAGSASAADIILPTMLATAFSTVLGVLLVKLFIKTDDKRAKKNAAPKEREKRKFGPVRAKSKGQG